MERMRVWSLRKCWVLLCVQVIHIALAQIHFDTSWRSTVSFCYQNSVVCRHVRYDLVFISICIFKDKNFLIRAFEKLPMKKQVSRIWTLLPQEHDNDQLSLPVSMALPDLYNCSHRKKYISGLSWVETRFFDKEADSVWFLRGFIKNWQYPLLQGENFFCCLFPSFHTWNRFLFRFSKQISIRQLQNIGF